MSKLSATDSSKAGQPAYPSQYQVNHLIFLMQKFHPYRHALNSAQLRINTLIELDVRKTLHARAADPCPVRRPRDRGAIKRNEVRALAAGGRAGLAPEVEKQGVRSRGDGVQLSAVYARVDRCASIESVPVRGRGGAEHPESEGQEGDKGRDGEHPTYWLCVAVAENGL